MGRSRASRDVSTAGTTRRRWWRRSRRRAAALRPGRARLIEALAEGRPEGVVPRRSGAAGGAEELRDAGHAVRLDQEGHERAGHWIRHVRGQALEAGGEGGDLLPAQGRGQTE